MGGVQKAISKEEFVTCVLANPVLSEPLRRLSTTDCSNRKVPDGIPIKLDVAIVDPTQEAAEEDFMDAMNVRQSILLEVWDHDTLSRDEFLGECWLPPLSTLGSAPKALVLPVRNAPADQEGYTRPHSSKKLGKKIKCTGDLFVEVSWTFPAEEPPQPAAGESSSVHDRAHQEEMLHTGKLHLKILKAEGLRSGAELTTNKADPYVWVYIRNETFGKNDHARGIGHYGWRTSVQSGQHDPLWHTSWKKGTVNPEWNEENTIMIQSGAFEKKMKKTGGVLSHGGKHDRAVLADQSELRIHFGESPDDAPVRGQESGHRHKVAVYLGDSIHNFRGKLQRACELEASYETDASLKPVYQAIASNMSSNHAVMVFVPSPKLRELHQQQREKSYEYRRLYKVEEQDPSSWQPLDPVRTFSHYAAMYGFGHPQMSQRLKVVEGNEDYKLKNNRYRIFMQDQARWETRIEETNTDLECFGYAQYIHQEDGGSKEWRQAIIERPEHVAESGQRFYKASFLHCPLPPPALAADEASAAEAMQSARAELDEAQMLLAPANARILGSARLEHREFLAKAWHLHDDGMADKDIVAALNDELKERWQKTKEVEEHEGQSHTPAPPLITLSDVQFALKHGEPSQDT